MTRIKKSPQESAVEMTELVLPNDTNLLGNLLGGRLMHWMDIAGGMSASRFANKVVVTAAVDNLILTSSAITNNKRTKKPLYYPIT